jgi:predicted small lipoprotein YifL
MRRAATALAAAALGLSLAGCGDDPEGPQEVPSPSASGTTASAESGSTSPSASATVPVAPAAGIVLSEATAQLNAPEGWTAADAFVDFASAADGPGHYNSLLLVDNPSLASPDATPDSLAESWFDVAPKGAKSRRLADVDLAGTPAYCIFYTVKGDPSLNYDVGTVRNGRSIDISIVLDKKTMDANPDLLESVLASFRWVA